MSGWIKLHRKIFNCWVWQDKPFSYGQAWIDLLLLANHEEGHKTIFDGEVITQKPGEIITSILKLSKKWGWDRKKVMKFLKLLEFEKMATTKSTTHGTTINVVNYSIYQEIGTTERTTKRTTEGQPKDNDSTQSRTKELKEIKEDNTNKQTKKEKHKYGTFQNVLLTDENIDKIKAQYGEEYESVIDFFSLKKEAKGYKYKNDYAAMKSWGFEAYENEKKNIGKNTNGGKFNQEQRDALIKIFSE